MSELRKAVEHYIDIEELEGENAAAERRRCGCAKCNSIQAIVDALAQPEQEPSAHMFPCDLKEFELNEMGAEAYSVPMGHPDKGETVPLYTTQPPRKLERLSEEELKLKLFAWYVRGDAGTIFFVEAPEVKERLEKEGINATPLFTIDAMEKKNARE